MIDPVNKDIACHLYQNGFSTRQVAQLLGLSKSWVYRLVRGVCRDKSQAAILRQPPKSKHWRSCRNQARKVWERRYGPIPKGFAIHHLDGDYTNNVISNLACLSSTDHARLHHPRNPVPRHLRPERKEYMQTYFRDYWRRRKAVMHAQQT